MGNTLKIALIVIGAGLIGYGAYLWIVPAAAENFSAVHEGAGIAFNQILAMIGFGALLLLGGLAYKRR